GGQKVTEAQVAAAQPDVIVLAWAATGAKAEPKQAFNVTAGKDVPAIRNRQVHVISNELLNTPRPPLIDGANTLYKLLQAQYDILAANRELIAQLATGRIKPAEILEGAEETGASRGQATD